MTSFYKSLQTVICISLLTTLIVGCVLEPSNFQLAEDTGETTSNDNSDAAAGADSNVSEPCGDPDMIDDMEDGDAEICSISNRLGIWSVTNDGTSDANQIPAVGETYTMSEIPGGREGSRFAARTHGSGFVDWAAIVAMVYGGEERAPFDGSAYNGIRFFAKSTEKNIITIKVLTVGALPEVDGGTCVATEELQCYDSYAITGLLIGADWSEYTVSFSEMSQANLGLAIPFIKEDIMGIVFRIPSEGNSSFDLWIDDLRFF